MRKRLLLILFCFYSFFAIAQNAPTVFVNIDTPLPVCNSGDCVALQANYLQTYSTNSNNYTVTSIPFAPGFPVTGGTVLDVTIDDTWSPIFNLPFPFCFYGQKYDKLLVGSNGVLTFDIAGVVPGGAQVPVVGGGCAWSYSGTIPSTTFPIKSAIYGVYQDINPQVRTDPTTQNINYYVTGTYPNRAFVLNTSNMPQFSCGTSVGLQTYQIILYETTNTIDVLIHRRTACTGWNGGRGVVGVMNQAGTLAAVPPGRNTGTWSATNEAWRFTPSSAGVSNVAIEWFNGATSLGPGVPGPISASGVATNTLNACPTVSTNYTAVVTYTRCDGVNVPIQANVNVGPEGPLPVRDPQNVVICDVVAPTHTFNINQTAYILNGLPPADYVITYHVDNAGTPGAMIPNGSLGAYTSAGTGETIWVVIEDQNTTGCTNNRPFTLTAMTSPSGTFSYPNSPFCSNDNTSYVPTTVGLTGGGTYTATPAGLSLTGSTGAINPSLSTPGTYTVNYDIPATASCPAYHTQTSVTVNFCVTCNVTASNSGPICSGNTVNLFATNAGAGATYAWTGPNGFTSASQNPVGVPTPTGVAPYVYTVTATIGGIPCSTNSTTVVVNPLPTASISGTTSVCSATGTNITFNGTPNATVTYTVNGGANQTIVLDGAGAATLPTGNLTVNTTYALVSVLNTTTTCSQAQSGSAVVTIKPLPTASISGTTSVCSATGTNITFNGTPNSTVTYTINGGANQTIVLNGAGTATLPTGNLTVNTTYALVSVADPATTCFQGQSGSAVVTINPLPTASISGTTSVCSATGTNITFNGTPNSTVTYTVNGGANQTIVLNGAGTATLPTGNLTVNTTYALVSVIDPATTCSQGQSGSAVVSINPLPTASISGTTSVCSATGTNITFNGTPNSTVTYTINGGANQTIVLDGTGTATLPTGNLTVNTTYALVSVLNTATTCSQGQSGSAVVSIKPLPTASISGTTTICSATGTNITFNGTPNSTVTYTINGGANQTIVLNGAGTATLPTGNLTVNTTYALVSVADPATTCSQVQSGSAVVIINPLPTASISGTASVCSATGTNITFNGTPNATVTYTINGGANQTIVLNGTGTATLPTGNLTVNTTYALVSVAYAGGLCPNTQSGSAVVTINPLPTASISGTTSVCSATGTNITFNGTPNATVTYTINGGANQTIVLNGAGTATLPTGNLTVNTTYALVSVAYAGGLCPNTQSGSAVVSIKPLPTASISGTTTICSATGTNITFNGTPNSTVTYTINGGANQTIVLNGTGTATLPTGNLTVNTTYALVSVADPATTCSQGQSGSAVVTVNPLPTASISGTTSVCSATGTNITFNGTPNAIVTYTVNGGANQTIVLNGAGTATLPTGNLTVNTTYALVSVAYVGSTCSQGQSGSAVVTINPLPTASISGTTSVCSDSGTNITFNGTPNATVTYTVNGGANQTIVLDAAGTATLPTGNLTANTTYTLVSVSSTTATPCSQLQSGSAIVTVIKLPNITLIDGPICLDENNNPLGTHTFYTGLTGANYTFAWYNTADLTTVLGALNSYEATAVGHYIVRVTDTTNGLNCQADYSGEAFAEYEPRNIDAVVSDYFAEVQTITVNVTPVDTYEYQLDNGSFQSSNIFTNVGAGSHTVVARNECGTLSSTVTIVDYPRFFTPNGDGYHDQWNISALSGQAKAKIYIFDRFGKLLKQIQPSSSGWDGTFNQKDLPATDYWFVVYYNEKNIEKEFKAHFALKR